MDHDRRLLLFLIKGMFVYGQVYLMAYVGQKVVYDLRSKMYRHCWRCPWASTPGTRAAPWCRG